MLNFVCINCGNETDDKSKNGHTPMNGYCAFCLQRAEENGEPLRGVIKCLVKNCTNTSDLGLFVGSLCYPCYRTVVGLGSNSQLASNIKEEAKRMLSEMLSKI